MPNQQIVQHSYQVNCLDTDENLNPSAAIPWTPRLDVQDYHLTGGLPREPVSNAHKGTHETNLAKGGNQWRILHRAMQSMQKQGIFPGQPAS